MFNVMASESRIKIFGLEDDVGLTLHVAAQSDPTHAEKERYMRGPATASRDDFRCLPTVDVLNMETVYVVCANNVRTTFCPDDLHIG